MPRDRMSPEGESRGPFGAVLIVSAGTVWLLLFCLWFFAETLPNNRIPDTQRVDLLLLLPEILAANFERSAQSGWHTLPQRFDLILTAAVVLAAAWGLGRVTLDRLRLDVVSGSAEAWALTLGVGLSLWSLLTLALGLCGLLQWPVVFALAATASLVAGIVSARRSSPALVDSQVQPASPSPGLSRKLCWLGGLIVAPFLAAMALGAMLPETDFDVKEYHLQGPKEWLLVGRIAMLPHNVYTSFPFLTEMLPLSTMALRGDWFRGALAGQLVMMMFAPITALGVYALGRRLFGMVVGGTAAIIWLTTPWTYRISIIAYSEGGISCYLLLTVLAVARTLQTDEASLRLRWALLSGFLAGSAASCKYPGVLTVVIPAGVVLTLFAFRRSRPECVRTVALYSAGVLAAFGPWMLKNLVETGNPVYPLLWSVFGGSSFDEATNVRWRAAHGPPTHLLQQPSLILPDLIAHVRDVALRSDWLSPLLFGLAPLSLLVTHRRRAVWGFWGAVGWLFFTWLWATHRLDRFWVPMIPVVSLLAGAGAAVLLERLREWWEGSNARIAPMILGGLIGHVVAVCVLFNLGFVTGPWSGYSAYLSDLDAARRDVMASSVRLLHAAGVTPDSRVLFVGEAMVFDADFPNVYNTVFDNSIFEEWFGDPQSDRPAGERPLRPMAEIREKLAREKIAFVCVHWGEILRYRLPGSYGYTDFVHPQHWDALVEAGALERTPYVIHDEWEDLTPVEQSVILDWAPELRTGSQFRRIEVYRVAGE